MARNFPNRRFQRRFQRRSRGSAAVPSRPAARDTNNPRLDRFRLGTLGGVRACGTCPSAGSVHARRNDTLITRAARFGCAGSAARVLPHDVMKEASLDLLIPPENSIDLTRCSREITSTLQSSLSARRCDSPRPGARLVPVPNKEPQGSADQSMKSNCDKVARGSGRKSEAEGRSDDK